MSMNERSQTRYPFEIHLQFFSSSSMTLGSIKNTVHTVGLFSFLFFKYPPPTGGAWGPVEKAPNWSCFCLITWCDSTWAEIQWETIAPHTRQTCLYESMGAEFWVASVVSNWRFATLWTCSPPGSPVHGILQARILEWVAISSSRGSSQPSDRNHISCSSCIAGRFFMAEPLWKASWINNRFQFSPLSKSLIPDTSSPVSIPTRHNLGRAGASSKSLQGLESLDTEYTDLLLLFPKRMFICSKCISFGARPPETTGKHSKGIWQGTSGYCNTDAKQMGPHFLQSIQYKPGTALFFWADFSSQVDQLALWMNTLSWAEGSIMAVARGQFFRLTDPCTQPNEHLGLCAPLSCHDFTLRCGCVPRLKSRDVL